MSHFPDEIWADLARGTLPPAEEASANEHLGGCADCRRKLETWREVSELGRRASLYEPPPGALESARALFARGRPETVPAAARIAELLFDSLTTPAPAGIRSLSRSTRHLCYKAGGYYVDLRIEEQTSSGPASVVGQVMRLPFSKEASLDGLPVTLARGSVALATTATNRLGEFQLDVDTLKDHRIAVGIGKELSVVVPLRARRGPKRAR